MCADDNQLIGVKDPRTGEIRKRADWSIIREPSRRFHKLHARFYCNECWEEQEKADSKPIPGIDKPPHASDFWRPSITAMIDYAMRAEREQKRQAEAVRLATLGHALAQRQSDERLRRIREMPPGQYKTLIFYQRRLQELDA